VEIEWQYNTVPGQPGHLVVVDGPMRQPFADYLEMNEYNVEYDTHTIEKTSALHHVPKERRMTFDDTHKKYTRLEAMKVAKEQASIREKAADYTKDGKEVPDDLVRKYNKALRQKLRGGRAREDSPKLPPPPRERGEPATSSAARPEPMHLPSQVPPEPYCPPPVPVVALMAHRGISLNGVPSYLPPSAYAGISRSWSGTNMPPNTTAVPVGMAPSNYVAIPGVAVPSPVGMAGVSPMANVSPAIAVTAVPVGYYR